MMATPSKAMTVQAYSDAFDIARSLDYPSVTALEQRLGYAIDRERMENAARILACPLKLSFPHWQHGRVIYAVAREYLANREGFVRMLDIGTAKGFSALCALWALEDSGRSGHVVSVDVLPPLQRVKRNTVVELDGLKTLREILEPWPESDLIAFEQSTGEDWLRRYNARTHFAFVDGKHAADVVFREGKLLAEWQEAGDVVIFDDCQMPQVSQAVASLHSWYAVEYLKAEPREYGIGRRR